MRFPYNANKAVLRCVRVVTAGGSVVDGVMIFTSALNENPKANEESKNNIVTVRLAMFMMMSS